MEKINVTNVYNQDKKDYTLKVTWESMCTRCVRESCLMRGTVSGVDCKNFRLE